MGQFRWSYLRRLRCSLALPSNLSTAHAEVRRGEVWLSLPT